MHSTTLACTCSTISAARSSGQRTDLRMCDIVECKWRRRRTSQAVLNCQLKVFAKYHDLHIPDHQLDHVLTARASNKHHIFFSIVVSCDFTGCFNHSLCPLIRSLTVVLSGGMARSCDLVHCSVLARSPRLALSYAMARSPHLARSCRTGSITEAGSLPLVWPCREWWLASAPYGPVVSDGSLMHIGAFRRIWLVCGT